MVWEFSIFCNPFTLAHKWTNPRRLSSPSSQVCLPLAEAEPPRELSTSIRETSQSLSQNTFPRPACLSSFSPLFAIIVFIYISISLRQGLTMQLLVWPQICLVAQIAPKCMIPPASSFQVCLFSFGPKGKLGHKIVFRNGRHQWLHCCGTVEGHQTRKRKKGGNWYYCSHLPWQIICVACLLKCFLLYLDCKDVSQGVLTAAVLLRLWGRYL